MRNKFDPLYYEDPWIVESVEKNGVVVHNAQLSKRKIRHVDDIKPYIEHSPLVSKAPSQEKPISKTFYTLPSPTVNNDIQPSASLPLGDPDAVALERQAVPLPPLRHSIAADRPQRKCKRTQGYKDFF